MKWDKLKYYFKQLFPLRYNTIYSEPNSDIVYVAEWRMWFGKVLKCKREKFKKF